MALFETTLTPYNFGQNGQNANLLGPIIKPAKSRFSASVPLKCPPHVFPSSLPLTFSPRSPHILSVPLNCSPQVFLSSVPLQCSSQSQRIFKCPPQVSSSSVPLKCSPQVFTSSFLFKCRGCLIFRCC